MNAEEKQAQNAVSEEANQAKLELWTPNTAVNWSLVFTPIFGAWVHAKNWETLNEPEKAKRSMQWAYVGAAVLLFTLFMYDETGGGPLIILLLLWYFISARKQVKYVKEKNIEYEKKSWERPILLGLAGWAVWICLCVLTLLIQPNEIELHSKQIVNKKIIPRFRHYTENNTLECVQVDLGEEFADNNYYATAIFNDGTKVRLTVQVKDEEIIVQVKGLIDE